MANYFLDNIIRGNENDFDFLVDVIFSFANSEEYLYLEYGYTWGNEFNVKGVVELSKKVQFENTLIQKSRY